MKKLITLALVLFNCFVYAQTSNTFKSLYALAGGTWQMKTQQGFTCEQWKIINQNELQSAGFDVIGSRTIAEEKVRLINTKGGIFYIPTVLNQNGGKEVRFKLISATNGQFVFSNQIHDFPQRIVYQFTSKNVLHAWVDGKLKGKFVKQDFYYKRVK